MNINNIFKIMSIHTVLLRKALAFILFLSVTGTACMNAAKPLEINKLEIKYLVEHKGVKFNFTAEIEYPVNDTRIQEVISKKLFGESNGDIKAALDKYLEQFDKVEPLYSSKMKQKKHDGRQKIIVQYHGREKMFIQKYGNVTPAVVTNHCETADKYASFACYAGHKYNDGKENKFTGAGIILSNINEYFTYDTEAGRLLTIGDVFTPNTIANAGLDANDTNLLIEPYANNLSIIRNIDGKLQYTDFNMTNRLLLFTEQIKALTDSIAVKNKWKEEQLAIIDKKALDERAQMKANKNVIIEVMPSFPGGDVELIKWLSKNIKYPAIAEENGVQGRVIVRFVVGKDGTIRNPEIVKSVDPSLDKEALRVIKSMPRWTPGKQNDVPVEVYFTLPVTFQLATIKQPHRNHLRLKKGENSIIR